MNEVEGLAVDHCQANATTATDLFIRTKQGCKQAVTDYAEANVEALQAAADAGDGGKVSIKFHKKLARWMRTAAKPAGCYLYYKGRKGTKIRGYFNGFSKLTEQETRAGEKIGTGKKMRQPLCKTFA